VRDVPNCNDDFGHYRFTHTRPKQPPLRALLPSSASPVLFLRQNWTVELGSAMSSLHHEFACSFLTVVFLSITMCHCSCCTEAPAKAIRISLPCRPPRAIALALHKVAGSSLSCATTTSTTSARTKYEAKAVLADLTISRHCRPQDRCNILAHCRLHPLAPLFARSGLRCHTFHSFDSIPLHSMTVFRTCLFEPQRTIQRAVSL